MEDILLEIAKKYNKNAVSVSFLARCKNLIYKVQCTDYLFVLRLSDKQHRNVKQIESELDFQKYLFENGADVSKPLQTENGESCISFETENSCYWVSAFEYIKGKDWSERTDNSEKVFFEIGKALGKIHRLSKKYNPTSVIKRRSWTEQQELLNAEILKKHSSALYDKYLKFMRQMGKEEKNENNYGLTHGDYLVSNYFFDDDKITVFDFDECEYSWYAVDLAICMRCYLFWAENPEELPNKRNEAEIMHYNLLLGYNSENKITKEMVFDLEKYIKIRDYIELIQLLEQEELNDIEKILYEMNLDRVLNDKPFLDFDTIKAEQLLL